MLDLKERSSGYQCDAAFYIFLILGDPDDTFLRKVETTILIPNMMKKSANKTWCKALNERK